ncbi:polysaccharide lyase family 1 protein [Massilia sp. YMA4]|uniref:pectate lyase family protein n=1 Tax=Massilia sp. YMA4 TaxID=1593482 RepID=UPI000DD0F8B1|nr:pectate lyase [Massilia sp. YMA4]AXA91160.1 pectate lyase [Massilia sp. YMA4]
MASKRIISANVVALLFAGTAQAADWPSGYSKCADQDGTCKVGGTARSVSFGIKDKFVVKTLSGDVACTVATFGSDPYPGVTKKCAIGPVSGTTPTPTPTPTPQPVGDASVEPAPATGWASRNGGTTGGAAAGSTAIYKVSSPSQLLAALKAQGNNPKIIKLYGTVDMAAADNGGPFKSTSDQALRSQIKVGSNTTLIGTGGDTRLVNGTISISGVQNVIVRNLNIVNPCDVAPVWDPNDGSSGNWNSEFDSVVISNSKNVWVDHNVFTDAPLTDDKLPIANGKIKQCHDGALDVKNGSDHVTVSNNRFELHTKNNLIGSSDSTTSDNGHLTVTFNGNHFLHVAERAPRVRFGMVHLYNNYFEGSRSHAVYPHHYSIGVAYLAKIISQNNAFDIAGASSCPQIMTNPGSSSKTGAIVDSGSLLNGAALDVANKCSFSSSVGWTVPYSVTPLAASAVRQSVLSNAGTGKLTVR